jgi:hypothetical protein
MGWFMHSAGELYLAPIKAVTVPYSGLPFLKSSIKSSGNCFSPAFSLTIYVAI